MEDNTSKEFEKMCKTVSKICSSFAGEHSRNFIVLFAGNGTWNKQEVTLVGHSDDIEKGIFNCMMSQKQFADMILFLAETYKKQMQEIN